MIAHDQSEFAPTYFDILLLGLVAYCGVALGFGIFFRVNQFQDQSALAIGLESLFSLVLVGLILQQILFWRFRSAPRLIIHGPFIGIGLILFLLLIFQRSLQWNRVSPNADELWQFFMSLGPWPAKTAKDLSLSPLYLLLNHMADHLFKVELRLRFHSILFSLLGTLSVYVLLHHWTKRILVAFAVALFFNFMPMIVNFSSEGHWNGLAILTGSILIFYLTEVSRKKGPESNLLQIAAASCLFCLSLPTDAISFLVLVYLLIGAIQFTYYAFREACLRLSAMSIGAVASFPLATFSSHEFWYAKSEFGDITSPVNRSLLIIGGLLTTLTLVIAIKEWVTAKTFSHMSFLRTNLALVWIGAIFALPAASPAHFAFSLLPLMLLLGTLVSSLLRQFDRSFILLVSLGASLTALGLVFLRPMPVAPVLKSEKYRADPRSAIEYLHTHATLEDSIVPLSFSRLDWERELDFASRFYNFRNPISSSEFIRTVRDSNRLPFRVFIVIGGAYSSIELSPLLWRDLNVEDAIMPSGQHVLTFHDRRKTLLQDLRTFLDRVSTFSSPRTLEIRDALSDIKASKL